MKYVSIDLETTGLSPENCDIVEFGAVIDDLSNPVQIENLTKFHCYVLPPENNSYRGEPYALSMHREIFLRIAERNKEENKKYHFVSPSKLGYRFSLFLLANGFEKKDDQVSINVAGKNFSSFDARFLDKTDFRKHVNVRSRVLDPSILFWTPGDETLPSMSVCKKRMGEGDNIAHTALEDAIDVIKLLRWAIK